jgi:hypothetical protein
MAEEGGGEDRREGRAVSAYPGLFPGEMVGPWSAIVHALCLQSVHSNLCEKNCLLYTLLQHGKHAISLTLLSYTECCTIAGVETTVDRSSKNNRIIKWIKQVGHNYLLSTFRLCSMDVIFREQREMCITLSKKRTLKRNHLMC